MSIPKPQACAACPLYGKGHGFSYLEGTGQSRLMVVAEALGRHEESDALPLRPYAAAGGVFQRLCDDLHIHRNDLSITNIVRCFTGDTEVWAHPDEVEKIYRRWYEGELVQVTTDRGILTGTPNHPVLTAQGWVKLGLLVKGRYVFSGSLFGWVGSRNPNVNYQPARFDQLFNSLAQSSIRQGIVGRDEDFHGDGFQSEIDVVPHDSLLRNGSQSFQTQHHHQVALERACLRLGTLIGDSSGNCTLLHLFTTDGSTSTSLVGSSGERLASFCSGSFEPYMQSLRTITQGNTRTIESVPQPILTNARFDSKGFEGFSGEVSLTKILHVDRLSFSGHVYNLQTYTGQYTANGHIVSNCRPPKNELLGMPYERAAIDHCAPYLHAAHKDRRPSVILALGAIPLRELAPQYSHLNATAIRGYILPSRYEHTVVIGTYHPAFIARGMWHLYGVMLLDTRKALRTVREGLPTPLGTTYELEPSLDRVLRYYNYLRANPTFPISYDVETEGILGIKEPARWQDKKVIQIQFSHRAGYALVMPYEGEYRVLAHRILALPNPKWGWNSRTSDDIVLRADGVDLRGELHDLMLAWGHYQPDFAGGKDEHEEKGIPTKLMTLQACTSFFVPEALPWKHESGNLPYYGALDVDYTHRCGEGIFAQLRARGLYDGYMEYKYRLRFALDDLGTIGLPVDRERQADLAAYVAAQSARITERMQQLVPTELRHIHPEGGFKTLSPKVRAAVATYDPTNPPVLEYSNFSGHLEQRDFPTPDWEVETRWCVRKLFNPNSSQQLLAYIKHMGYPVPRHIDTKAETTNAFGLETLLTKTDDEVLRLVQQQRKLTKLGGTYAGGDWLPGEDGRVHPTFGMLTGSGQTTARGPNVQQYPQHYDPSLTWLAELMKKVKSAIRAEPGRTFAKIDLRAFHARMQGFLAEDAAYYRLASLDCHSFVTAHYVGVPDKDALLQLDDATLLKRLKEIKKTYEYERNYMVKRISFLNQYLGGAAKAATILRLSISEVETVLETISNLFPAAFSDFPDKVRDMLSSCHVTTPFGCHRFIWDRKIQEGVASVVANSAHCHVQSALIRLHKAGVFQQYEAVNFAHDSLWLHPRESEVEEAVRVVKEEFERPSEILTNSLGAFYCFTDAEYGPSMTEMTSI